MVTIGSKRDLLCLRLEFLSLHLRRLVTRYGCYAPQGFVVRGSPGTRRVAAQSPDRRSPSFRVCSESTNADQAKANGQRGRPSVGHSGGDPSGARRPAPNTSLRHFRNKIRSEINHGMAFSLSAETLATPHDCGRPIECPLHLVLSGHRGPI